MKVPEQSAATREEKALHALVSVALYVDEGDVSLEEIQPYLEAPVTLSPEDEAALKRKGSNPLVHTKAACTTAQTESADAAEFMALHRKRPEKGFSAKTEEEIRHKRAELLAELQKKKKKGAS